MTAGTTPRRARRLAARGYATKAEERAARSRAAARLAAATTTEDQLAAAYDLFRAALRRMPAEQQSTLCRAAAQYLVGLTGARKGS